MEELREFLMKLNKYEPEFSVVIGSGLGSLLENVDISETIPYKEIPDFPISTVMGHKGEMVFGKLANKNVVFFNGRVHYYEGYSMKEVTMNIRVSSMLGVKGLIVSNASGAVNPLLYPGDILLIKDHINLMFGDNPLRGEKGNEKFVNMIDAYDSEYRKIFSKIAHKKGINVREGVYCAVPGPNFETFAELNFMSRIGADAVGMSTVPEVILARFLGIRVLGLSCVTDNVFIEGLVTHSQVLEVADKCGKTLSSLIGNFLEVAK